MKKKTKKNTKETEVSLNEILAKLTAALAMNTTKLDQIDRNIYAKKPELVKITRKLQERLMNEVLNANSKADASTERIAM